MGRENSNHKLKKGMMDSQEKALGQGQVEEEQTTVQAAAEVDKAQEVQADAPVSEEPVQNENSETEVTTAEEPDRKTYTSKKEVLERIREIAHNDENPEKDEVEYLKSTFYRLHIAEREEQQKAYLEEGGDPEKYQVRPDDVEEAFKAEMQVIKEKRAKLFQKQEEERANNLKHREEIIEKINEKLAEETDIISAFHQLQELHAQYRETGPVAKDLRDEIWTRFKNASTVINKKHQQHFEELRAREEENLTKKTALCEKVEAIAKEENKGTADWEKHSQEIIAIQQEWKTIGFAPQKMNVKIFERFRTACDDFFGRKAEYFKEIKKRFAENAEKKRVLVEKAKALADSTDWKSTSDKIIALQKEWKNIGTVPKKVGDELWKNFQTACNNFFEARHTAHGDLHSDERENLKQKKAIIAQLKALLDETKDGLHEKVQTLMEQYNKIGHVPFKEKDKLYQQYHEMVNKLYDNLHVELAKKHLDNFKTNLQDMAKRGSEALDSERGKLLRRYENLKQEIITYENNLGFLNSNSSKGSSLIEEMNRKVQRLKDEMELTKQKIKAIDKENK